MWDDPEQKVRTRAAEAIVSIGEPASESLAGVLEHDDNYFRWRAVWALGHILLLRRIENRDTLNKLIALLEDDESEVRWITIKTLGGIRNASAIEPLIKMIEDDDPGIRLIASTSLANLTRKGEIRGQGLISDQNKFRGRSQILKLFD